MSWILPALMALGSGTANALMGNAQRGELNSRIDALIKQLKTNEFDTNKVRTYSNNINSIYNNNVTNTLNQSAFSQRGALNGGVVRAAMTAPLEASRLQALNNLRMEADKTNLDIQGKIGQLELSKATGSPASDFASGAIQGGITGMQLDTLMKDPLNPSGTDSASPNSTALPSVQSTMGQPMLPYLPMINSLATMTPEKENTGIPSIGSLYDWQTPKDNWFQAFKNTGDSYSFANWR